MAQLLVGHSVEERTTRAGLVRTRRQRQFDTGAFELRDQRPSGRPRINNNARGELLANHPLQAVNNPTSATVVMCDLDMREAIRT